MSQMYYILSGNNCYAEKGIREGSLRSTVSSGSSALIAIGRGLRQHDEFKVSLKTDISLGCNPSLCNVETEENHRFQASLSCHL